MLEALFQGYEYKKLCIISLRVEVWLAQRLKAETQLRPATGRRTKRPSTLTLQFPLFTIFQSIN
jgi:hypothetical protein